MDLAATTRLLAGAIAQPGGIRFAWGRWDGSYVWLDDAPDIPLAADNAAGALSDGQRVLTLLDGRRVTIIGPSGTTLEAHLAAVQAYLARLPRAMAAGEFVEPDGGATISYISFPVGRFLKPPVVTVTLMGGAGSHTWDTPRVLEVTLSGFRLFSRNGAGARFAWHAIEF